MTSRAPSLPIDLLDPHFYVGDPHPTYEWMRKHDPVYRDDKNQLWAVTRLDDLREVEKDPQTFSSQGHERAIPHAGRRTMISQDDPQHLYQRNLISDMFTPRAVAMREEEIRTLVVDSIERFFLGGAVDVVEAIAARVPAILTARLLGFGDAYWTHVKTWSERLMRLDRALREPAVLADAIAAIEEFGAVLHPTLLERASQPQDDIPARSAAAARRETRGERPIDYPTALDEVTLLVSGGAETTRTAIAHALILFCDYPHHWEDLASEPERIPVAVEEILRFVTPLNNMFRRATTASELNGKQIRPHDRLILLYPSANRDESYFEDPHAFVPDRDPNPHIAFGFGTHYCLGAALARITLRIVFEELTSRLTRLVPAGRPVYEANIFVKAVKRFDLAYERR
jgi:cytochrome P450 family 142 subfamily A polypeptide 1